MAERKLRRFAATTSVSVDRSRAELEALLGRFGVDGFAYAWEGGMETVGFVYTGKRIRLSIALPERDQFRAQTAWDQERRRRLRVLVLAIKALLVAVEDGVVAFEDAFLSWLVTPGGQTIGELVAPELAAAVERGVLPPLMLPNRCLP
jgi:hypothetical protein